MTNKERLENMSAIGFDLDGNVLLKSEDYHWLMEQAELAEQLVEENDELAERVHKLALGWSELVDEINRYKQALEFYAHKKNYDIKHLNEDEHEIPVFKDYGEKARNALEGEKT